MKKIFTILTLLFSIQLAQAQLVMTFQPSGGLNNGTDSGTATAGKDTWVNRYSPTMNNGGEMIVVGSPRSNCNTSDYKAYFQFDVSTLPDLVDSVFFGVTHYSHTTYCYSNCDADFYFYRVTSPWDEMALVEANLPSEDSTPIYGPINITFPNDFQQQEYDITNAYNYWKTNGNDNFGFAVYSPTIGCNNAAVTFYVHSSDDTVVATRPYLKIYYRFPASINETVLDNTAFYPNPFSTYIKSTIANPDAAMLIDITGRALALQYQEELGGFATDQIAPGLYVLQLIKDGKIHTSKLFKQ